MVYSASESLRCCILASLGFSVFSAPQDSQIRTSVFCCRLRLGTTPVIFVSIIPQCLVGALLTFTGGAQVFLGFRAPSSNAEEHQGLKESSQVAGDTSGIMPMVSSAVTLAAATVQASEMFFFSYRIMKVPRQRSYHQFWDGWTFGRQSLLKLLILP